MDYLLPMTLLVGTWAFLAVLGNERERRNRYLDRKIAHLYAVAAENARIAEEMAAKAAARAQAAAAEQ